MKGRGIFSTVPAVPAANGDYRTKRVKGRGIFSTGRAGSGKQTSGTQDGRRSRICTDTASTAPKPAIIRTNMVPSIHR